VGGVLLQAVFYVMALSIVLALILEMRS